MESDPFVPLCLDVGEVAVLLDLCFESVYAAVRRKALPSITLVGARRIKIPREAVEALLGHPLEPAQIRWATDQVRQARERQRRRRHRAVREPTGAPTPGKGQ